MKRLLLILMVAVLTSVWAHADLGGFTTPLVRINAVVHEDNSWDITETVVVDFNEYRHGIYRYIPTRFFYGQKKADGTKVEHVYTNIIDDITVTGYDYNVETDGEAARNVIIRIGSANSTVFGEHTYVINYTMRYMDDRMDGEDFLNSTIWGDGWNTYIDKVDFSIKFDKPLPASAVKNFNVYSGSRGSTSNTDGVVINVTSNEITGHVDNLPANHAITFATKLPQGHWKAENNHKLMIPFYFFVLATIVCVLLYFWGIMKTPNRKPVPVVSFYPPEGMSSAEVGKIIDDSTDPVDLASLIPWLAHRGHIKITEIAGGKGIFGKKGDLRLDMKVPLMPDAPYYQKYFIDAIFDKKKTVYLNELGDCHVEMDRAKKALDTIYTNDRKLTDVSSGVWWWLLMLVCYVGVMWTGHVVDVFSVDTALWAGCAGSGAALIVGLIRLAGADNRWFRKAYETIIEAVVAVVAAAIALAIIFFVFDSGDFCIPLWAVYASTLAIVAVSFFCNKLSYDTDYRLSMIGELLGLKEFINTAEKPRLEKLVDENPEYFYDILPFAMVFGISDKWADQFANIKMEKPDWYSSTDPMFMTSPVYMAHAISSSVSDSISSAVAKASVDTTSSSSSGGWSGGGSSFSGGGGGGGGGGSW